MNWRLWTWNGVTAGLVAALMTGGLFYFFFFVPHYERGLKMESDCGNPTVEPPCAGKPTRP